MVQSMNTKVEYTTKASYLDGLTSTGTLMVGDKALEYYNEKNTQDYVQIPWDQVDYVSASVVGKKSIPRWAVFTRASGHFTFSARDNKAALRAIREHVPADRIVRSLNFFEVVWRGIKALGRNIVGVFRRK